MRNHLQNGSPANDNGVPRVDDLRDDLRAALDEIEAMIDEGRVDELVALVRSVREAAYRARWGVPA